MILHFLTMIHLYERYIRGIYPRSLESTGSQSPYENRLHLRRRVFAGGQRQGKRQETKRWVRTARKPWSVKKAAQPHQEKRKLISWQFVGGSDGDGTGSGITRADCSDRGAQVQGREGKEAESHTNFLDGATGISAAEMDE